MTRNFGRCPAAVGPPPAASPALARPLLPACPPAAAWVGRDDSPQARAGMLRAPSASRESARTIPLDSHVFEIATTPLAHIRLAPAECVPEAELRVACGRGMA